MRIGERVFMLLKQRNRKQNELAQYLNTSPSTINGWKKENRNPSAEYIIPICEFLEVSTEYLLTGKDIDKNTTLSADEQEVLHIYKNLDSRGRAAVKVKAYEEQDRMEGKNYMEEYSTEIS